LKKKPVDYDDID